MAGLLSLLIWWFKSFNRISPCRYGNHWVRLLCHIKISFMYQWDQEIMSLGYKKWKICSCDVLIRKMVDLAWLQYSNIAESMILKWDIFVDLLSFLRFILSFELCLAHTVWNLNSGCKHFQFLTSFLSFNFKCPVNFFLLISFERIFILNNSFSCLKWSIMLQDGLV